MKCKRFDLIFKKMQTHLYGKALKQRRPEKGVQRTVLKNPGRYLSAYQQMQLTRQKGRLTYCNQLCIRRIIEISRTDGEQTKQWYTNSGYLLSVQEYVSSNDIRLLDYLYCGADFSKEETQR